KLQRVGGGKPIRVYTLTSAILLATDAQAPVTPVTPVTELKSLVFLDDAPASQNSEKDSNNNGVTDVTAVTGVSHMNGGNDPCLAEGAGQDNDDIPDFLDRRKRCAQCNDLDDGSLEPHRDGKRNRVVFLHRECVRFWQAEARKAQAS